MQAGTGRRTNPLWAQRMPWSWPVAGKMRRCDWAEAGPFYLALIDNGGTARREGRRHLFSGIDKLDYGNYEECLISG
jgi:hypothetical protein